MIRQFSPKNPDENIRQGWFVRLARGYGRFRGTAAVSRSRRDGSE